MGESEGHEERIVDEDKEKGCPCDEMKRRVRGAYRAFRADDVDAIMRGWAANARFYLSGENILRWGGEHNGATEIRAAFEKMKADTEVLFFESLKFCIGSVVVSIGLYRFRCRQSGRRFRGFFLHLLRFNAACELVEVMSLFDARRVRRKCPATARIF